MRNLLIILISIFTITSIASAVGNISYNTLYQSSGGFSSVKNLNTNSLFVNNSDDEVSFVDKAFKFGDFIFDNFQFLGVNRIRLISNSNTLIEATKNRFSLKNNLNIISNSGAIEIGSIDVVPSSSAITGLLNNATDSLYITSQGGLKLSSDLEVFGNINFYGGVDGINAIVSWNKLLNKSVTDNDLLSEPLNLSSESGLVLNNSTIGVNGFNAGDLVSHTDHTHNFAPELHSHTTFILKEDACVNSKTISIPTSLRNLPALCPDGSAGRMLTRDFDGDTAVGSNLLYVCYESILVCTD